MATRIKPRDGRRRITGNAPHWIARGCAKTTFPSRRIADGRARQIGNGMEAYKCPLCKRWHVGHPSGKETA